MKFKSTTVSYITTRLDNCMRGDLKTHRVSKLASWNLGRWFECIAELRSENGKFCTHIEGDNTKYIEPQKGQVCIKSEATYNPRLITSSYCENITWAAELLTKTRGILSLLKRGRTTTNYSLEHR